jgi:hypothetical protein
MPSLLMDTVFLTQRAQGSAKFFVNSVPPSTAMMLSFRISMVNWRTLATPEMLIALSSTEFEVYLSCDLVLHFGQGIVILTWISRARSRKSGS